MIDVTRIPQRDVLDMKDPEEFPNEAVLTIVSNNGAMKLNTKAMEALKLGWGENSIDRVAIIRGYDNDNNSTAIGAIKEEVVYKTKFDGTYDSAIVHQFTGGFRSSKMLNILKDTFKLDEIVLPNEEHFLLTLKDAGVCELTKLEVTTDQIIEDLANQEIQITDWQGTLVKNVKAES